MITMLICGFGRCGSSLAMQMLAAGGMPTTGLYPGFEDEAVMATMKARAAFYRANAGRAIKVLDPHLYPIPGGLEYRAVWLDREPREQAKSIVKWAGAMLGHGVHAPRGRAKAIERGLQRDRAKAIDQVKSVTRDILFLTFEQLVEGPASAAKALAVHAGVPMDEAAMAKVVRTRGTDCLGYLLESELLEDR